MTRFSKPAARSSGLAIIAFGLVLTGCDKTGSEPSATPAPAVKAGQAVAHLPAPRPGLWRTTTATADGEKDVIEDCIEAGATPLQAIGAPQLAGCDRNEIHAAAGGYDLNIQCSSDGMTMAVKGAVRGDFQTTMTMDIAFGLGADDGAVETTRLRSESRYVGACPAA